MSKDSDYVEDPVFGRVPKDAETHRRLYLESLTNPKVQSPVDPAPVADGPKGV